MNAPTQTKSTTAEGTEEKQKELMAQEVPTGGRPIINDGPETNEEDAKSAPSVPSTDRDVLASDYSKHDKHPGNVLLHDLLCLRGIISNRLKEMMDIQDVSKNIVELIQNGHRYRIAGEIAYGGGRFLEEYTDSGNGDAPLETEKELQWKVMDYDKAVTFVAGLLRARENSKGGDESGAESASSDKAGVVRDGTGDQFADAGGGDETQPEKGADPEVDEERSDDEEERFADAEEDGGDEHDEVSKALLARRSSIESNGSKSKQMSPDGTAGDEVVSVGDDDVLLVGKGTKKSKAPGNNPGNKHFRALLRAKLQSFKDDSVELSQSSSNKRALSVISILDDVQRGEVSVRADPVWQKKKGGLTNTSKKGRFLVSREKGTTKSLKEGRLFDIGYAAAAEIIAVLFWNKSLEGLAASRPAHSATSKTTQGNDRELNAAEKDHQIALRDGINTPTEHDVLFGRGGMTNSHPGNRRFRDIIALHRDDYVRAIKIEKPNVAKRIVKAIRNGSPPGRFLKKDMNGKWYDVGDRHAAEKASQALRERTPAERAMKASAKDEGIKQAQQEDSADKFEQMNEMKFNANGLVNRALAASARGPMLPPAGHPASVLNGAVFPRGTPPRGGMPLPLVGRPPITPGLLPGALAQHMRRSSLPGVLPSAMMHRRASLPSVGAPATIRPGPSPAVLSALHMASRQPPLGRLPLLRGPMVAHQGVTGVGPNVHVPPGIHRSASIGQLDTMVRLHQANAAQANNPTASQEHENASGALSGASTPKKRSRTRSSSGGASEDAQPSGKSPTKKRRKSDKDLGEAEVGSVNADSLKSGLQTLELHPPVAANTMHGATDEKGNITVTDSDILCGRGGMTNHHIGNKRFRDLVTLHRPDYIRASKMEKPNVSRLLVSAIRSGTPPGRFLKKDTKTGKWFEIGDKRAAEKASQALREKVGTPVEVSEAPQTILPNPQGLLQSVSSTWNRLAPTMPAGTQAKPLPQTNSV